MTASAERAGGEPPTERIASASASAVNKGVAFMQ
jgi:hypothetical protein